MSLKALIKQCIEDELLEVYTSIPGKIVSYDPDKQSAQVKPLQRINYDNYAIDYSESDETEAEFKEIDAIFNVPVKHLSAAKGKAFIHMPIEKGDLGMLCFTSRSIDEYLSGVGEAYDIVDTRHHDLSDAYFLPGILPFGAGLSIPDDKQIIINNGLAAIEIGPSGKFAIKGPSGEFLDFVSQLMQLLSTTTVATMMGPQPLSTAANITALKILLDQIKGT